MSAHGHIPSINISYTHINLCSYVVTDLSTNEIFLAKTEISPFTIN